MAYRRIALGDAGVLAPGRWRWARALGWIVALMIVCGAGLVLPAKIAGVASRPGTMPVLVLLGGVLLAYVGYVVLVRGGERRMPQEIAPGTIPIDLGTGLLIGAGMFTLVFASLRLLGLYTMVPGEWTDWLHDIVQAGATGFSEELIARAIIFRLLMRAFGVWPALIASSALFGAAHLGNPNATWLGAAAIAIEAGTMLAGFYLLTGRLWMSIGVHAAWNFMQGPVFGARVSGHPEVGSLFVSTPVAGSPEWASGGIFGPEASLSAIVVGLAVFVVTWLGARRRGFV